MKKTIEAQQPLRRFWRAATTLTQRYPLLEGVLVTIAVAVGIRLCEFVLSPLIYYSAGSAVCWPTDGILLAVVLMCRRRIWPWIGAGFVIDQFVADQWTLKGVALDSLCNLFEIFVCAYFLPPFRTMRDWIREPLLILRFTLIALILVPLAAALPAALYFSRALSKPYWTVVLNWECSDALGFALWTPLVFSICSKQTYEIFRPARLLQTLTLLGLMLAASWAVFSQNSYPLDFLLFPMLVVLVNLLGFSGAVISINAATIIAASATIRGHGPFMFIDGAHQQYRIVTLQIYLILAMLMSFATSLIALEKEAFDEKLQRALKQMELLAVTDALTGLGNRRLFDDTLQAEWRRAMRDQTSIALLLLDADHFKRYNDLYGHPAGDTCLQSIAESLATSFRRTGDLVARYGGEEFVVLLPQTTPEDAINLADRLREHVLSLQIEHNGNHTGWVTVSIGCSAVVPRNLLRPDILIHAADRALYSAKQNARNSVAFSEVDDKATLTID